LDKVEYKIKHDEIKSLVEMGAYQDAVEIADEIDWRKVKSVKTLCMISDIYKINRRYEDARNIMILAYEKNPESRTIVFNLCELSIKIGDLVMAVEYCKEYAQLAPHDIGKHILTYKIYKAQGISLEEQIAILEELKSYEYREKWAYELAYLYHRVGLDTKCVQECDEIFLWFGEGKYVIEALELKKLHTALTPQQQAIYDHRFDPEEAEEEYVDENAAAYDENYENYGEASEEQDADILNAPTTRIPVEEIQYQIQSFGNAPYDTVNLQQEIADGIKPFLDAESQQSVDQFRFGMEPEQEEEDTFSYEPAIEEDLPKELENALSMESDGQISLVVPEQTIVEKQITGQMNLEDILKEWEDIKSRSMEKSIRDVQKKVSDVTGQMFDEYEASIRDGLLEKIEKGEHVEGLIIPEYTVEEPQSTTAEDDFYQEDSFLKNPDFDYSMDDEGVEEIRTEEDLNRSAEEEFTYEDSESTSEGETQPDLEASAEDVAEPVVITTEGAVYTDEIPEVGEETTEASAEEGVEAAETDTENVEEGVEYTEEYTEEGAEYTDEYAEEGAEYTEGYAEEGAEYTDEYAEEGAEYTEEYAEEGAEYTDEYAEEGAEYTDEYAEEGAEYTEEYAEEGAEYTDEYAEEGAEYTDEYAEEGAEYTDEYAEEGAEYTEEYTEEGAEYTEEYTEEGAEYTDETVEESTEYTDEYAEETAEPTEEVAEEAVAEEADSSAEEQGEAAEEAEEQEEQAVDLSEEELIVDYETREMPIIDESEIQGEKVRALTPEEEDLFKGYVDHPRARKMLTTALDAISLAPYTGNVIITGDDPQNCFRLTKCMIKDLQATDSNFNGKIGKVSGKAMNTRNVAETFERLKNGALIIQGASAINDETADAMYKELQNDSYGILVIVEDTRKAMKHFMQKHRDLEECFTSRMEVKSLSDRDLVKYGIEYAKEQEYSIDEMGVLEFNALITSRQTSDHLVSKAEVREIIDQAIAHAKRITIGHFFDIIFAKRYDENDMVILRAKDFKGID